MGRLSIYIFKLSIYIFSFHCISNEIYTIEIDGSNLPNTEGDVIEGKRIFSQVCSQCHGHSGEGLYGPELVGRGKLSGDEVSKTVGNFWPFAPKIFDFLKRAKRNKNNEFFTDEEVYSLTGYILELNGLFTQEKINKKLLSEIKMPNRDNFISDYY